MKCFVITKNKLINVSCCLLIGIFIAVSAIAGITKASTTAKKEKKLPIYCVDTQEKKVALSFDAAWGNEDTQNLIDILGKYNAKATFFVVGGWVDKYPESVKALHDAGHDVMNHSNTHPHMPKLSMDKMIEEANTCSDKIEKITGVRPTLLRPPYGDYDDNLISAMKSINIQCIQWDVDSLDWKDYTAEKIQSRVIPKVKNGSIVLFHNAAKHTPEALPAILEELKNQGYEFVKINDLIYKDNYHIDTQGKQVKNADSNSKCDDSSNNATDESSK